MSEVDQAILSLIQNLPAGIAIWRLDDPSDDGSLRLLHANPAADALTGADLSAAVGRSMREVLPLVGADRWKVYADAARTGKAGTPGELITYGDDRVAKSTFRVTIVPLADRCVATWFENITLQKRQDEAARRVARLMNTVLETMPAMVFVKDAQDLRFELFNRSGERLLGVAREDMIGKTDFDFFPRSQAQSFQAKDRDVLREGGVHEIPEEPIDTPMGRRWLHTKKVRILDEQGTPQHLLGISLDITDRRLAQQEVERQAALIEASAITDELTGLYNRRGFLRLAEQHARVATRREKPFAIMFVDLDALKTINDVTGHAAGDAALRRVAAALQASVRAADIVGRLGGDEFVVLVEDATQAAVDRVSARVRERLSESEPAVETAQKLSVSIGAAFHTPMQPASIEDLLVESDREMYTDKRRRSLSPPDP